MPACMSYKWYSITSLLCFLFEELFSVRTLSSFYFLFVCVLFELACCLIYHNSHVIHCLLSRSDEVAKLVQMACFIVLFSDVNNPVDEIVSCGAWFFSLPGCIYTRQYLRNLSLYQKNESQML